MKIRAVIVGGIAHAALFGSAVAVAAGPNADWRFYGGDPGGARYTELKQIGPANVSRLTEVWRYDLATRGGVENQPIVVDGVLYGIAAGKTFALDAATGRERWSFAPTGQGAFAGGARGLSWWSDGKEHRIFANAGNYIWALDPATGQPIPSFGTGGKINLNDNLRGPPENNRVRMGSPVNIYRNIIMTAGGVGEETPASPGDIRGWDARTGTLIWTFHTIPHPGEPGYETWPPDAYQVSGGANNWPGNVLDEKRGILYVATGSPSDDYYGGERLGANLYGNSLIALDAATGHRLWHFRRCTTICGTTISACRRSCSP